MNFEEARALAQTQLKQGQTLEAEGTSESLGAALACYDQAINLLQGMTAEAPVLARRDHAVAWMNRGNILQRVSSPDAVLEAIFAYEQAISLLQTLPLAEDNHYRNSLGAAWMNRGHALQRQNTPESIAEAVRSHGQAIYFLQGLPLDEHRSFRLNLAAAWMNQANALAVSPAPVPWDQAIQAARTSLTLTAAQAETDPVLAEMSLRGRLTLEHALTQMLPVSKAKTPIRDGAAAELSDLIDDGMALVRHWEKQNYRHLRPLALLQYRIGSHFYFVHQPHFLAEFLLESLDPERAEGALLDAPDFHATAHQALTHAMNEIYNQGLATSGEENQRKLEVWTDLKAASERLNAIAPPPPATA